MADAPASFDVFAVSPEGYEVHIQLNGQRVYDDGRRLLAQLARDGFKPRPGRVARKDEVIPAAAHAEPQPEETGSRRANNRAAAHQDELICEEHGTPYRAFERDGQTWYAHRLASGQWCRYRGEAVPA